RLRPLVALDTIPISIVPDECGHHRAPHSFPTRRSSDLVARVAEGDHDVARPQPPLEIRAEAGRVPHVLDPGEAAGLRARTEPLRSEEHTSELQSRETSYAVFCLTKKKAKPSSASHEYQT